MTKVQIIVKFARALGLVAILGCPLCLAQSPKEMASPETSAAAVIATSRDAATHSGMPDADWGASFTQAVKLQKDGQMEAAARLYLQILSARPHLAEAHNNLAMIYQAIGQLDLARQQYTLALQEVPDYGVALNNYASLLFGVGEYFQARALWTQAAKRDPLNSEYCFNLALGYLKTAEPEEALHYVQMALKLNPGSSAAGCLAGRLWRAQKNFEKALQFYQNSLSDATGLGLACREEARQQIQELKALLGASDAKPQPSPAGKAAHPRQEALPPQSHSPVSSGKKNKNRILSAVGYVVFPFKALFWRHEPQAVAGMQEPGGQVFLARAGMAATQDIAAAPTSRLG